MNVNFSKKYYRFMTFFVIVYKYFIFFYCIFVFIIIVLI